MGESKQALATCIFALMSGERPEIYKIHTVCIKNLFPLNQFPQSISNPPAHPEQVTLMVYFSQLADFTAPVRKSVLDPNIACYN